MRTVLREKSRNWMCRALRTKDTELACACPALRTKDAESELVRACALRKKRRNWHAHSAEGKEQELDVSRAEDKGY